MHTLENQDITQVRYRDMSEEPWGGMSREGGITVPVYMSTAAYDATVAIDSTALDTVVRTSRGVSGTC